MFPVNDDKREQRAKFEFWRCWNAIKVDRYVAVNIKEGLRTADCGLRTADCGLRTTDCGLRTEDNGLGIKHGLKYKTLTKHYGLGKKLALILMYKPRTTD